MCCNNGTVLSDNAALKNHMQHDRSAGKVMVWNMKLSSMSTTELINFFLHFSSTMADKHFEKASSIAAFSGIYKIDSNNNLEQSSYYTFAMCLL